ncbi:MerR family transcriptional regulator [Alkalilimnicola ehrlichii]|uniref:MerR family transcriptional regulator n=1 Tax=Alkalilimnicola ehrlichii TaxID=351052 RepID=UPI003BA24877
MLTVDGLYPIRTATALTGVNPVTLRAWERRYGLIRPQRTPKGHRLYSEADIARIKRILELLEQGIPISRTREVLDREAGLNAPAAATAAPSGKTPWTQYRDQLRQGIIALDALSLDRAYNEALSLYPLELVGRELLLPLLDDYRAGSAAGGERQLQAHFLEAYLRHRLGARFHHQLARARGPRVLSACLPGEICEIPTLFFALCAVEHGYRVVYTGRPLPLEVVTGAARREDLAATLLYGDCRADRGSLQAVLSRLPDTPAHRLFLSGPGAAEAAVAPIQALPADISRALQTLDRALLTPTD